MNCNRIIAVATALSMILCAAVIVGYEQKADSFIILHTNDSHCHYDDEGSMGFETLSALKDQLSKKNVVFTVDAGDYLQGAAYGLFSKGGSSVEVMNLIGYDLVIPGNHDFDFGSETMMERMSQLNCPVICANLVNKYTEEPVFDEYLIIEKGGFRVGFFGLLTTETPITTVPGNMGDMTVTDPVDAAKRMVSTLKEKDVDCTVAVGHLGVDLNGEHLTSDQVCAQVQGIDIFIDGHSHTEMEDGKICDGSRVLEPSNTVIASTGCYMKNIGVITYTSDGISAKLYRSPAKTDMSVHNALNSIHDKYDKAFSEVIGQTNIRLDGDREDVRNRETNLGDLLADTLLNSTGAEVALINGGSIRISLEQGDIILLDIYNMLPFVNYICTLDVKGSDIWAEMEYSFSLLGKTDGGFLQVAGMEVTYDPNAEAGHRVVSIEVNGTAINPDATYKLATIDFIWLGGDGNTILVDYDAEKTGIINDVFTKYIKDLGTIEESSIIGGRLLPC